MKSHASLLYAFVVLLNVSMFSCKQGNHATGENDASGTFVHITKEQFDNAHMQTGSLQKVEFHDAINVRGIADVPPQSKATVSPVVCGSVKEIFVHDGERVKKGQPLLSFEGTEIIGLQQNYLEISEQLKSLESEYKRQKTLFDENVSSEKLFLEAEGNYKKAAAACEGLKQQLLLLNIDTEKVQQGKITPFAVIYSSITGDIIHINADISKFIQPSDIVAEISDNQQLQLYLSVFEKDITCIKSGQKVIFSLTGTSNKQLTATVNAVGKAIDRTDRTATVQAHLDGNAQAMLLAGMYIDAGIVTDSKTVWALPVDAVITEGEEHFVLLLNSSAGDEYVFQKAKVHTGKRCGDNIEIFPDEAMTGSSVILLKGVYNAI